MRKIKTIAELDLPEQAEEIESPETRDFMLRLRLKPSEKAILKKWMKENHLRSLSDAVRNQCGFELR